MSALFVADGRCARLVGINRQIARRLGERPFVFRGCVGPVRVAPLVRRRLEAMLDALATEFGLRGLNGLDFLLDGDALAVLELNPRPPASIALYRDELPGGLLRAHVEASLRGRLPAGAADDSPPGAARPRGFEVVFATRPLVIDSPAADALARRAWCHDLPVAGARVGRGEPLCTVSAVADAVAGVEAQLLRRRRQIPFLLEQPDERSGEGARLRAIECQ